MLLFSSVFIVAIVAVVAVALVVGVRSAAIRAGFSPVDASARATRLAAAIVAWLAVLAALASSGLLARFDLRPPPMFLVLGGALALFTFVGRRPEAGALLDAAPRAWPVAMQTMRVPIELMLYSLFAAGRLPIHLTFEGRNFDVLVGLSAPLVAYLVHTRRAGSRVLLVWNVASLALLANIVGMAITTMPGPLHLPWAGVENTVVAELPFVFLPGFLVPLALFGHVASLRQLARGERGTNERRPTTDEAAPQRIGGGL